MTSSASASAWRTPDGAEGPGREPAARAGRPVQPVEEEAADAQPDLFGDQPPPRFAGLRPVGRPARRGGAVGRVGAEIGEERALHHGLLHLPVDGKGEEIGERQIGADEFGTRFHGDGAMRDRRPEEDQPPRLDRLAAAVEQVGHAAVEQQVDLDMIVPVGRAHGVGDVALDVEGAASEQRLEGGVVGGYGSWAWAWAWAADYVVARIPEYSGRRQDESPDWESHAPAPPIQARRTPKMTKICLVGAGSTVFAQNILGDVLSSPGFTGCTISLFDIDPERLKTSEIVARRIAEKLQLGDVRIEATLDRRQALTGADFVILMMQVGGYRPATVTDFEVPKRYGLRQTIADTLGIGGIFRGLRTIPVLEEIVRDMEEVCPDALMMNYVNPMAINSWAVKDLAPELNYVGLCHSVQHTAAHLADCLGEDIADIDYVSAGINHVAFFLKYQKRHADGTQEDLYPRLKALAAEGRVPDDDRVRFDVLRRLGYFVTEFERALLRIYVLVHQGGARRPDRRAQHSARRVHPPVRGADRRMERPAQGTGRRHGRSRSAAATSTPPASSTPR